MLRAAPSILCTSRHVIRPVTFHRHFASGMGELPGFLRPFFQYASDAYATQGIQAGIEFVHSMDVPYAASFVIAGLALRVLTSPMHIMAEKLFAKRFHLNNYLTMQMFERVSKRHGIPVVPDPITNEPKFAHSNQQLNLKANSLVKNAVKSYFDDNRLQYTRIMMLKTCTIPVWFFSAFAIRNILYSDFGVSLPGYLWIDSFLQPDPYFILPAATVLVGFLNVYTQRKVLPAMNTKYKLKIYDGLLGVSMLIGSIFLSQMPACIPLYWLTVGLTGLGQTFLIRHPRVKQWLGIQRLPTDLPKR